MADNERARRQLELDKAYRAGDLERIRSLSPNPESFPNSQSIGPLGVGDNPLEYAIYHSPIELIATLLEMGADLTYDGHDGFPPLIAALSSDRKDLLAVLEMLLEAGADLQQRGVNEFSPLHWAARYMDVTYIELLLTHGADPNARTRIDDFTTPLEEARAAQRTEAIALLEPLTD